MTRNLKVDTDNEHSKPNEENKEPQPCCCCGPEARDSAESGGDCPACAQTGGKVANVTVKHLVTDSAKAKVGDDDYNLCMNPDCDVAYYNLQTGARFDKADVRVPIWFKSDADPKIACYCNDITEQQVITAVTQDNLTAMNDIITHIRGKMVAVCEYKNPMGVCCSRAFNEAIQKAIAQKGGCNCG